MNTPQPSMPSTLEHLTHDLVNRLTVINLCSSELRHSIAEKLEPDQLREFKRLEDAVLEAADIVHKLRATLQNHAHPARLRILDSTLNRLSTVRKLSPLLSRLTLLR
jgi:hypothetical protein